MVEVDWIGCQVRRELTGLVDKDAIKLEATSVAARVVTGAFMEVMRWWLDEGAQLSPAEIDRLFQTLAFDGERRMFTAQE